MKKRHSCRHGLQVAAILVALSTMAGIALSRIEPSGNNAGLIQFDVVSELNMDWTAPYSSSVVFARYWVCQDYYAVSVVWSEPHGVDVQKKRTTAILSDRTSFRMSLDRVPDSVRYNATYPKPSGERGPFKWGGGLYGGDETRFAEVDALSKRVYVGDLGLLKDMTPDVNRVVDVKAPNGPDGIRRRLAQLKVHAQANKVQSVELFDNRQQLLARMRYEYERDKTAPQITQLVADLPVRHEKLAVDSNMTISTNVGGLMVKNTYKVTDVNYVSHKGGRTCTVTYRDVTIGDKTFRLPVQVEVRNSQDKRLIRSAKFMNFKRVDLDEAGVWEAAKAYAALGQEYRTSDRLYDKYLDPQHKLGIIKVDPNDLAFVRRLIAKYPLPKWTYRPSPGHPVDPQNPPQLISPPAKNIEPNDARAIRELLACYSDRRANIHGKISESEREVFDLTAELNRIQGRYYWPALPEDRLPEPNDFDSKLIHQLQGYHEKLVNQQDRGIGDRLKAMHVLTRLDLMLKDYNAFEGHTTRYLQMLHDAALPGVYMTGGCGNIEKLVDAGQYDRATKLLRQWADRSATDNEADRVFGFCRSDEGGIGNPWAAVQVLDRFLKRSDLSLLQRYEGLALRAIALDRVEKLFAAPRPGDGESRKGQTQWVLSTTTRAEIARTIEQALSQAVSAWQSLGPARLAEAKPYSTADMPPFAKNAFEPPEATRLQETSAQLDQIVQQRLGQRGAAPRAGGASPGSGQAPRSGTNR